MSDDITFCYNTKCKNKKCERHPVNILIPYREHSFAFFKECEYWNVPETYYAPSDTITADHPCAAQANLQGPYG